MGGGGLSGPFVRLGLSWMQWSRRFINLLRCRNHAREYCMNAMVHLNGICRKIKTGDSICEHQSFSSKRVLTILSNAITSLSAMDAKSNGPCRYVSPCVDSPNIGQS